MVDVGPAGASSSGSSPSNSNGGEEDKKDERMFECNICLDTAKDAVISMCGHLFWYVNMVAIAHRCNVSS